MNYQLQLDHWDLWIREGQSAKVRSLCRKLNHKTIPRALLLDYAQIARRVGAADLIVLWLRPIVRSEKILNQAASENEKAIYGLGLLRLGAFREASQILSAIDPLADPQVYFYQASLHMNQWNYKKAIPNLKRYLKVPQVPAYSKLVGRLNLCAALVSTKKTELAGLEINCLINKLQKVKGSLLMGNLLEIRSQWLYYQGRFPEALTDLDRASEFLQTADARSRMYVQKWRLIIQLKSKVDVTEGLRQLEMLKKSAIALKEWETVRDCDLYRAIALEDSELFLKVYWGSKFPAFKERVKALFGVLEIGQSFIWIADKSDFPDVYENSGFRDSKPLDLVGMAPTPALKKLFFILTRELYQPLRATEILDLLYSDQYYHPTASSAKIQQLITRARQWLQAEKIPLTITSYGNSYRLQFLAPARILITDSLPKKADVEIPVIAKNGFFNTKQWANELSISSRLARKQILTLVKKGIVASFIRGPQTKYKLK